MFRNKILVATLILVIAIILCICFLKKENEIKFVKIGSFDWLKPISSDNPPFGTLWWSITQAPESYISLASFSPPCAGKQRACRRSGRDTVYRCICAAHL